MIKLTWFFCCYFSSRFTDSKKYETDFIQCFQLEVPRRGEICNACVLLVKRFKRLPPGSNRHWGHVVDARTGPGLKSMTKFKKRKEEQDAISAKASASVPERFIQIFKKTKKKDKSYDKKETNSLGGSSDESPPSPTESQHSDEYDETIFGKKFFNYTRSHGQANKAHQQAPVKQCRKRKNYRPSKNLKPAHHFNLFEGLFDDDLWRKRVTCCGIIYECTELNAVIMDANNFIPCMQHNRTKVEEVVVDPTAQLQKLTKMSDLIATQNPHAANINNTILAPVPIKATAIKKHQLFLKRQLQQDAKDQISEATCDSSMEISNKQKTDNTSGDVEMKIMVDPFHNLPLTTTDAGFLRQKSQKLSGDSLKLLKPQLIMSTNMKNIAGEKGISTLKTKIGMGLANIIKCGTLGDNSSDSGYEEVQELLHAQKQHQQSALSIAHPQGATNSL